MTNYDNLLQALGGAKIEEASSIYQDWSPNNVRTVFITLDGVYVEYHVGKPKVFVNKEVKKPSSRNPLRVFSHKQFSGLETLIAPAYMLDGINLGTMFPSSTRLTVVGALPETALYSINDIAPHFHTSRQDSSPDTPFFQLGIFQNLQEVGMGFEYYNSPETMTSRFVLVPQTYSADLREGKLATHLYSLAPAKLQEPSLYSSDSIQDIDTEAFDFDSLDLDDEGIPDSLENRWETFQSSPLKSEILDLLRTISSLDEGIRTPLATAMASLCLDLSSLDNPPAWFTKALSNFPELGTNFDESFEGVLMDCSSTKDSARYFYRSVPADIRDQIGLTTDKAQSISDIIHLLKSLSQPSPTPDPAEIDDAVAFYSSRVQGSVRKILEEYARIFASGYSVLKPYGVLTANSHGYGKVLHLSSDGRVLSKKPHPFFQDVWKQIQDTLGLVPVDSRNIQEIAHHVVSRPNERLYFPYKMLEYAFGRQSNSGDKDLYPPHATANSWSKYATSEVQKSLTDMLSAVVRAVVTKSEFSNDYYSDSCSTLVDSLLGNIERSLCTCVLISSYDELNHLPVKAKIRVLSPSSYGNFHTYIVRDAMVSSTRTDGGEESQSYPIHHEGLLWEFRHDLDAKLANVEPLFAYKLLQAEMAMGKRLGADGIIFGVDDQDRVLSTNDPHFPFNLYTTHVQIGGSRSGKGLITQATIAGFLARGSLVGLTDFKPDMASLFLHINPNAFVINGSNLDSSQEGSDLFNIFTEEYVASMERMAHIPEYLTNKRWFIPGYRGTLGTMVYLRFMLLSLGIIAARVALGHEHPAYEKLGGDRGIVLVFDELNSADQAVTSLLYTAISESMLPARYMEQYKAWVEAGMGDKKRPSTSADRVDFWVTSVMTSLKESVLRLQALEQAGLNNREAGLSNIFLIGQLPFDFQSDYTTYLPVPNASVKGIAPSLTKGRHLLPNLANIGQRDAILGYNRNRGAGNILNQLDPKSHSASRLNSNARKFAYVPDFSPKTAQEVYDGVESHAKSATYFKPALLFARGGTTREDYCWPNAVKFMQASGLTDIDGVIARNADESGNLHPATAFQGYLELAGISLQQASDTLQLMADAAQYVVSSLGYPGTWKEFLLDLRPEWIFSVDDIYKVIPGYMEFDSPCTKDFQTVYPEDFHFSSSSPTLGSEDFDLGFDGDTEYTSSDTEEWDDLSTADLPSSEEWTEFDYSTHPDAPPVYEGIPDSLPILPNPIPWVRPALPRDGGWVFQETPSVTLDPSFQGTLEQHITHALLRWVGGQDRVRSIAVLDGVLLVNNSLFKLSFQDAELSHISTYYGEWVRYALENGNVAPFFDWKSLPMFSRLTQLSFDSYSFFRDNVDTFQHTPNFRIQQVFTAIPSLRELIIGSDKYLYSDLVRYEGIPTGLRTYDTINRFAGVSQEFFMKRGLSASADLWRSTWQNRHSLSTWGTAWRLTASAVGVGGSLAGGAISKATRGGLNTVSRAFGAFRDALKEATK